MSSIQSSREGAEDTKPTTVDDSFSQRVVALTPTPQDTRLCRQVLEQNGIAICCCDTVADFLKAITTGAGIALIAQEHLSEAAIVRLKQTLACQPKWPELPILVLLPVGEVSSATLQRILSIGHVTLINRPLRIAIFTSTVLAKLRDRQRQFEVRDLLLEKDRDQQILKQSSETFRRLIEDSPQGLYVVDSEMRMRYASWGARKAFTKVDPLIGCTLEESLKAIWSADVTDDVIAHFRHTLETGETYTSPPFIHQRVDKDTTEAYNWSIERIVLPGGGYGVVCYFYDNAQRQLSVEILRQTLFQPFVQGDSTSTRSFGGTGLGLAICRRLAQALGGDISLESEYGKGSTFTLTIDAVAKGPLVERNLSLDVRAETPVESLSLSANILVVDDRRDIRYLAQHFIEKAGGRVLTATNGQEAIDVFESSDRPAIDLIVMDMQMPVMDGYAAVAELRRRGCVLPIIALTANAMKSDRDACLAAGCTDYTTKPLDSPKLIAMIHRLTTGSAGK